MFESIIDDILGMDDSDLFKAGSAAFDALNGSKKKIGMEGLDYGKMPLNSGEVKASKSKAVESADARAFEAEWLQRLNKFSSISNTMAKPR